MCVTKCETSQHALSNSSFWMKGRQETGAGYHMGHRYSGAFAYTNCLNMLSPSLTGLSVLISECDVYAEYNIVYCLMITIVNYCV